MPRKNTTTYDKGNFTFKEKPEMRQVVHDNYEQLSIVQLVELTDIKYASMASYLENKGLVANRYALKRKNIKPLLELSGEQTAYLCGMIDGDGTITVQYNKRINSWRPMIIVTNTSYFLMMHLESLGFYSRPLVNNFGSHYFSMSQSGIELLPVLQKLEPLLIIKKLQCQHLIALCKLRMQQAKGEKPTAAMLLHLKEIRKFNVQSGRYESQKKLYLSKT